MGLAGGACRARGAHALSAPLGNPLLYPPAAGAQKPYTYIYWASKCIIPCWASAFWVTGLRAVFCRKQLPPQALHLT